MSGSITLSVLWRKRKTKVQEDGLDFLCSGNAHILHVLGFLKTAGGRIYRTSCNYLKLDAGLGGSWQVFSGKVGYSCPGPWNEHTFWHSEQVLSIVITLFTYSYVCKYSLQVSFLYDFHRTTVFLSWYV